MSGSTLIFPPTSFTPQQTQDYIRGQVRGSEIMASNLAPGAVAQVLPAREDDTGKIVSSEPGLLSSIYGAAGTLPAMLLNHLLPALGYNIGVGKPTQVPELPGART